MYIVYVINYEFNKKKILDKKLHKTIFFIGFKSKLSMPIVTSEKSVTQIKMQKNSNNLHYHLIIFDF